MLKIGIRGHDVCKDNIEEFAKKVSQKGFSYVQLVLQKAFINDNGLLDENKVEQIYEAFSKYNVNVAMLGAYFNPFHSDKNKVATCVSKFQNHLRFAKSLNSSLVGTETGSYNNDKWTFHEYNYTEVAYETNLTIFEDLVKIAEENDVNVALEGAYHHCMGNPRMLNRLVRELNSDNVKVIVDLYNYLYIGNHEQRNEIFKEAISLMKDKIVLFHLKDYIVDSGKLVQVGLGQGLMDFPFIIKTIKENFTDAFLIFEGVVGEDIDTSLSYIKSLVE
mgnify:CR=1 FL=1